MAREFAQVRLSIWDDDDFRALPPNEQHLYFALMTSRSLSHCGVADWRPVRIAKLAANWSPEAVSDAAAGLINGMYILVDSSTEEVLVRSFIRHDRIMNQPKMAAAMSAAHGAVASPVLRGVVVHELNRLKTDEPDLKGWMSKGVQTLLDKGSVDPSTYPLGKGSVKGSSYGSAEGIATPSENGCGEGSGNGSPTTAPTTATSNQQPDSLRSSEPDSPKRARPKRPLPDAWEPTEAHRVFAAEHGIDIDHEVSQFRAHADSHDRRQVDWNAAFRMWMGNNIKWDKPRLTAVPEPSSVDGFQLPAAPKEIIDDPDPTVYVRWAKAQRDAWLAERSPA